MARQPVPATQRLIAIDPGETCGWAAALAPGQPYTSGQCPPSELFMMLWTWCETQSVDRVIIEEYRIYPNKAMAHAGKTIPTAEIIGAIKFICSLLGVPFTEQPANVLDTTKATLKGRGIQSCSTGRHAKDAEVHLWYYSMRGEGSR